MAHDCYGGSRLAEYDALRIGGYDHGHRCAYPDRGPITRIRIDDEQEAYLTLAADGSGVDLVLPEGRFSLGWPTPEEVERVLRERAEAIADFEEPRPC